jgi:HK97 family phage prohead protease
MVLYKTVSLASVDGGDSAEFTGYASTWTRTPDAYGDVVAKGAFAQTLADWQAKGRPIPVLWGHRMDDPTMFVGVVREAIEDDHGLKVTCSLDVDDNPNARLIRRLLKTGAVAEMSFAFDIDDYAVIDEDGQKVRELRALTLYEVSVVPIGANRDTSIEAVKAASDVGGILTVEQWQAVKDLADERLAAATTTTPEEGVADDNAGEDEGAEGVKFSRVEAVARLNTIIEAL